MSGSVRDAASVLGRFDALKSAHRLEAAMVEPVSLGLGVAAGALATFLLLRTPRKRPTATEPVKLTTGWRVTEFRDPVLVVRDLQGVAVPHGARVVASGLVDAEVQHACEVRQVPPVRAEYVLDREAGRALLWLAGARPDAWGLLTSDEAIVSRLDTEFRALWDKAEPYVERYRIADLSGRQGVTVETEGEAQDVLPWQDQWMLRLEDQGHVLGVLVPKDPSALVGQRIVVRGRLDRDRNGYVVLAAQDIRRVG